MSMEMKTSLEWMTELNDGITILDPDGWDRKNFTYSFMEEKITKEEFLKRRSVSTCALPGRGD